MTATETTHAPEAVVSGRNLGKAVKVDEATYDHLRRIAVAEDRTISAVLRRAVSDYGKPKRRST